MYDVNMACHKTEHALSIQYVIKYNKYNKYHNLVGYLSYNWDLDPYMKSLYYLNSTVCCFKCTIAFVPLYLMELSLLFLANHNIFIHTVITMSELVIILQIKSFLRVYSQLKYIANYTWILEP